jgi:hypothetical protein
MVKKQLYRKLLPKSRDIITRWGQMMAPTTAPPASWLPFLIYRRPLAPHSLSAVLALALRRQRETWLLAPHSQQLSQSTNLEQFPTAYGNHLQ